MPNLKIGLMRNGSTQRVVEVGAAIGVTERQCTINAWGRLTVTSAPIGQDSNEGAARRDRRGDLKFARTACIALEGDVSSPHRLAEVTPSRGDGLATAKGRSNKACYLDNRAVLTKIP